MTDDTETSQTSLYEHSAYYKGIIKRSLRYLDTGYPLHFTGPSGIGKTTLALHIAKQRKRPVMLINGNKDLSTEDFIGAFTGYKRRKLKDNYVRSVHKIEENVTESWSDGRLLEAVKKVTHLYMMNLHVPSQRLIIYFYLFWKRRFYLSMEPSKKDPL